ncbi:putative death-receptor fusion protein-domain-containing protein [Dendryphion nanum]|uniref:Death-receptor fusion protein-domain-containing protein n=1 Tax=Dendryphion nanum TaxID=256645 RepID=A0A9P9IM24_9PLEO|nr:putative death-receptor fusion protein-domain-containing protein [Dendryphion nanum]
MVVDLLSAGVPVPEQLLREVAKDLRIILPNFAGLDQSLGVKQLNEIIEPILDSADVVDLSFSHRTAASNTICALIEYCQATDVDYVKEAILDDAIWYRVLEIYLQRSDNAKGKSMRQMLLVLTGVLQKAESSRSYALLDRAVSTFIEILCQRSDRVKVKPALQGLAHFLLKKIITIPQLLQTYGRLLSLGSSSTSDVHQIQSLFKVILSWVVHHDTALSAGHLVKNFLLQIRQSSLMRTSFDAHDGLISPLWIVPVVEELQKWPDRLQEFKTHVFPHCFLPHIEDYLRFLSYLHFHRHVPQSGSLPEILLLYKDTHNGLEELEEFRILLGAISTGKELGIIKDVDHTHCATIELTGNALNLPDDIFSIWMSHPEPEVRLAGLFLSIYSTAVTRPITAGIFRSLKQNLVHLHTDTDANFRKEVLNQTQRLFDRLRGSTSTLLKTTAKTDVVDGRVHITTKRARNDDELSKSYDFILWYIHFIQWEIRPTASYQRRITALRCLSIVLRSGIDPNIPHRHLSKSAQGQLRWICGLRIANKTLVRILMDLILDPFDDVRSTAVSILDICMESLSNAEKPKVLSMFPAFLRRVENMMLRSGRADQADGLARSYALLFSQCNTEIPPALSAVEGIWTQADIFGYLVEQLEKTIDIARVDLSSAVDERPVHGIFAALRYIVDNDDFYPKLISLSGHQLNSWKQFHLRICAAIDSLWVCVENVLCADAPEGHVPEDFEEEANLDTKEILSYSWRGLKEASVLLRTIITRAPIGEEDFLSPGEFERLGKICFTQLVELRHRGAFSTVAQTFAAFCRRCVTNENEQLRSLPAQWYQETILCIQDKATSITRRSAGIPSLMAGIVSAEATPGALFHRAMQDLIATASQTAQSSNIEDSRLPQVHALNCIQEIFTTSRLSVASEAYTGNGLDLAARLLSSPIWPIRNCSLMLFKALIERLLGSDEAQDWKEQDRAKTSRFSYTNYPSLVGILSNLLDPNGPLKKSMVKSAETGSPLDLHGAEGVFPALQIIRQAPPPDENRTAITESVLYLLGNPHWHLRDMAARTVVSLKRPHEYLETILEMIKTFGGPHDLQHGQLLCLKYMLQKFLNSTGSSDLDSQSNILLGLRERCQILHDDSTSLFVRAAFVDLVNLCGNSLLIHQPQPASSLLAWSQITHGLLFQDHTNELSSSLFDISSRKSFLINHALLYAGADTSLIIPEHKSGFVDMLSELAKQDSDTFFVSLEAFREVIHFTESSSLVVAKRDLIVHLYEIGLRVPDADVKMKTQEVMTHFLECDSALRTIVLEGLDRSVVLKGLDDLERQCLEESPGNLQSALHLYGFILGLALKKFNDETQNLSTRTARFVRLLRMTIVDINPFDSRFAAVQSLSALTHTLSPFPEHPPPIRLALTFTLYDLLNDDDDEIRDAAALTAAKFLPSRRPVVPILATHILIQHLSITYHTSSILCKESLRRLLAIPSPQPLFFQPFTTTLAEARTEDTSLFVQEKQNLYKDDAADAALWTRLLKSLSPLSIPPALLVSLTTWVLSGLEVLTETARSEKYDGAGGWTSKVEVWILGLRVLCAAEVVLQWDRMGKRSSEVRRALRVFGDVGVESAVNGAWMERVERVLGRDVEEVLKLVKERLVVLRLEG